MASRSATVHRDTLETRIRVTLAIDGAGAAQFATGLPFLEHMLDQVARHGLLDLDIYCAGDTHIDDHHSVEDIGITLGQAMAQAIGPKTGICRYGHAYVPLDEALSRVVVDFSGRPGLIMHQCPLLSSGSVNLTLSYSTSFFKVLSIMPRSPCISIACEVRTLTIK